MGLIIKIKKIITYKHASIKELAAIVMRPLKLILIIIILPILTQAQNGDKFHNKYDTTKSAFDNFVSGFANEFFENGNKFRIRANDTGNGNESPMILEKFINSQWVFVDSFEYTYCFSHSLAFDVPKADYNNDGIKDFVLEYRWNHIWGALKLVFTYDKYKKTLFKIGFFSEIPKRVTGYSNLYYDVWYDKWNEWSYIYTIKNNERINLGIAELKVKVKFIKDENKAIPQFISIRQLTNSKDIEIKTIDKNKIKQFNYKKYWTENAKLFLNQKSENLVSQKDNYPERFEPFE